MDNYLFVYIRGQMEKERDKKLEDLLSHVHNWPAHYNFKFIYKSNPEVLGQLKSIFPENTEFRLKHSKKKNFESLNVNYYAKNSEAILRIYKKASEIKGVIVL